MTDSDRQTDSDKQTLTGRQTERQTVTDGHTVTDRQPYQTERISLANHHKMMDKLYFVHVKKRDI